MAGILKPSSRVLLSESSFKRAAEGVSSLESRKAAVMQKTLYEREFITVEAAVKILTRAYGQDAQSQASRRAHYARMAGQRDNYRFWEKVLQKLAGKGAPISMKDLRKVLSQNKK